MPKGPYHSGRAHGCTYSHFYITPFKHPTLDIAMSVREALPSATSSKEGQDVNFQLLLEGACSSGSLRAKLTRKRCVWISWKSFMLDSWVLEIISMIFSTACFIAIVAILVAFNGKKRPNISYDLSLNTIISMLATACKSSLVFAVGEAIGQLKWVWFQDRRELAAMQSTQIPFL